MITASWLASSEKRLPSSPRLRHNVDNIDSTMSAEDFASLLAGVTSHIAARDATLSSLPTIPSPDEVAAAVAALPSSLPDTGLGTQASLSVIHQVLNGCSVGQAGPRYFGFVTGGVTPAAQLADMLLSSHDENVQVSLPTTAAVRTEQKALQLVLELLGLEGFEGRTITTGATASNVLGMACARDAVASPASVLALHPHFSIVKACSLVGLGRKIVTIPPTPDNELAFDLIALKTQLEKDKNEGKGSIVVLGLGEVNTGGFPGNVPQVAELCKEYGAWLHVDAAFGGFAAAVPELAHLTEGMYLADSITLDGHKWLNVPYDCGLFFTRKVKSLTDVLGPGEDAPAYLASKSETPSPLYVNIENSRRFRALPLLASLVSLGREGYVDIFRRNCAFARQVAEYLDQHPSYELLNRQEGNHIVPLNIVLFAEKQPQEQPLADRINNTRKVYVSGTAWRGQKAVRLAVSNWRTGDADLEIVKQVFDEVVQK